MNFLRLNKSQSRTELRLASRQHTLVCAFVLFFANTLYSPSASAGAQVYEELSLATQNQLSELVSDTPHQISSFKNEEEKKLWLDRQVKNVSPFIKDEDYARILLETVHYEAIRAGLEPELMLGLMTVESGFKKYAISSAGARGYTQVMPFWLNLLGKDSNHNLFHLRTSIRYGCVILRHYLDVEQGNMTRALARYNGSLGRLEYPNAVFASSQRFYR